MSFPPVSLPLSVSFVSLPLSHPPSPSLLPSLFPSLSFRRVASAGRASMGFDGTPSKPTKPTTKPSIGRVVSGDGRKGGAVEAGTGTGAGAGAASAGERERERDLIRKQGREGRALFAANTAGERCCQSVCPGCGGWQYRDVMALGDCDEGATRLLKLLNPVPTAKTAPAAPAASSFSLKPSVSARKARG